VSTDAPGKQRMPGEQKAHEGEPVVALKVPSGQRAQVVLPAVEVEPAGQAVQPAAASVPGFVTVPKKPAAHMVHVDSVVLPVSERVVVMPAGQEVQDASPAFE
jgi:hypothetical protein